MYTLEHQVFQFASFRLDLTRGCVFDGNREIELRPKSFEALCYLVENAGRLVSERQDRVPTAIATSSNSAAPPTCQSHLRPLASEALPAAAAARPSLLGASTVAGPMLTAAVASVPCDTGALNR